ncbi:MAG: DNA polymerase IV [Candidatus Pacebacteria bacterium]|nr:DNA polymerase IV [Candidatus Paceibacterota bacterium]MBP9840553.1 DNA polymerase IV [Candidatus Paceibacterota bacterium]
MAWGRIYDYPRAILHIDGDSFFASCEMAVNPLLKGKPVVTGSERGIASSMSYEAKRQGVSRGMTIPEIRKACPDAIILPSDYETYSLFSKRMFEIVRRYTPQVEEYSIDECYADLTGLRRRFHKSYEAIAEEIRLTLERELGMTFSAGLAPTKSLAKIGSKLKKPSGITYIRGTEIEHIMKSVALGRVCGIGPQTLAYLSRFNMKTVWDFAGKREEWIREHMAKPHIEIWRELNGEPVDEIVTEEKHDYQSISKTKTFTPPSRDREFVFSQLSRNIENACIKLRRHSLSARSFSFFIKDQSFHYRGFEVEMSSATSVPQEVIRLSREPFMRVWKPGQYRATGITFTHLTGDRNFQPDLFGASVEAKKLTEVFKQVDVVEAKFGKHTVFLGSSMKAMQARQHESDRGAPAFRKQNLFKGETKRQRLNIPMLGEVG